MTKTRLGICVRGQSSTWPRIIFIIALALALTPRIHGAQSDQNRVEIRAADGNSGVKEVRFIGRDGKVHRALPFDPGERIEHGRHIRKTSGALKDKNGSHVVVWEEKAHLDQRIPTDIRSSYPVQISWYQADGTLLCEQKTSLTPRVLSADGHILIAVRPGWDPVGFERYPETPTDLREALIESRLVALDQSCQVVYSTSSMSGGWEILLLSPSGKWLAFAEPGAEKISVVNLKTQMLFKAPKVSVQNLSDAGELFGWKYIGKSNKTRKGRWYGQEKESDIPLLRYRKLHWKPGASDFEETVEVKEE